MDKYFRWFVTVLILIFLGKCNVIVYHFQFFFFFFKSFYLSLEVYMLVLEAIFHISELEYAILIFVRGLWFHCIVNHVSWVPNISCLIHLFENCLVVFLLFFFSF